MLLMWKSKTIYTLAQDALVDDLSFSLKATWPSAERTATRESGCFAPNSNGEIVNACVLPAKVAVAFDFLMGSKQDITVVETSI